MLQLHHVKTMLQHPQRIRLSSRDMPQIQWFTIIPFPRLPKKCTETIDIALSMLPEQQP